MMPSGWSSGAAGAVHTELKGREDSLRYEESVMSSPTKRGVAAAGTVVVAAAVNVATGMLTQHWAAAWWAFTLVLIVLGGGLQWWLTVAPRSPAKQVSASGDGAIASGGAIRDVTTKVSRPADGPAARSQVASPPGVSASGLGAIASERDITRARTEVGDDSTAQ
jgi:hypothetical protein